MLTDEEILSIVSSELSNSDNSHNFEDPMSYYLGLPNGKEVTGRSEVISTDVADAIEWIMPQIMKSFTQNNEIVIFDPVHPGDEKQAELESEYVYEVLMKQNDGFIILHQFVKDALLQRNGIIKVYYAKHNHTKIMSHTGINEDQLQALLSAEGIDVLEKSEYVDQKQTEMKQQQIQMQLQQMQQQANQMQQQPPQPGQPNQMGQQLQQMQQQAQQLQMELQKPVMIYDVKISVKRERGQIYVESVPPENFRVSSGHNSINVDKARFTAHVETKTVSEIIEEYDIKLDDALELPEGDSVEDTDYRFTMQGESVFKNDSDDPSQKEVSVSECFMYIDVDEVGIAKYMKITVAGDETPTDLLDKEEIDESPWITTTAILMSHKFQGLSIYDRIKQIQDQKTSLWRNMLDNMYLQNNQRNVIIENQVNMDDLLVSRPGGIIRAKRLDAIMPLVTPPLGQDAYNMMEYLDRVRASRTGVDADGQASPANIGDRVGSQGVDRLMNAKEELVGLIIRVIAETGIKPLCVKIRNLSINHIDAIVDFKFRGSWHKVSPSGWPDRTNTTVRVGTGTGNHAAMLAAISQVMAIQEKILSNPQQTILTEKFVFTAIDDFCKFSGLNSATRYFLDPDSDEGKQNAQQVQQANQQAKQKQDQIEQLMVKSQVDLSQAELGKMHAQQESVKYKAMAEQAKNELDKMKAMYEAQLKSKTYELEEAKAITTSGERSEEMQYKYDQMNTQAALELTRIEAEKQSQQDANYQQNKGSVNDA